MSQRRRQDDGRQDHGCAGRGLGVGLATGLVLFGLMADARAGDALSFRTDILPILTKAGCNGGACHGAATGQGGFKLSLLGYDPEEDHARITRELGGRRLDFERAENSLFLLKPTGRLDHDGGRRIARSSEVYPTLLRWIGEGAGYGARDLVVSGLVVAPADHLFGGPVEPVQLSVRALLSDGTEADVTALALYNSNDEAIADVNASGQVTAQARGLTSIMIRYSGQVTAARVAIPLSDLDPDLSRFPIRNFIDNHIRAELIRLHVPASPVSGDAEFFRRVHLDVTGSLPSAPAFREFLSSPPSVPKRARLIDELMGSEAFVDFWTMKLADLLLIGGKGGREEATRTYHEWVRGQLAGNAPFDRIAGALLTSIGEVVKVGPANFMMLAQDPRDLAEHVGRIFLGTQIACARCHAHPSDRWTQEDYHRFAAYFARVSRDADAIAVLDRGEVDDPKTGEPVTPKPLGGPESSETVGDRRHELAAWLTSPENALFARATVNRVWKELLGRGLVEPVDDLRPTNPPTHPELLTALAEDFAGNGFDMRRLVRTIVSSGTYQLSSRHEGMNRLDERLYSRAYLKPLRAQVFADAVARVTGVSDAYEGYPAGTRAVQLMGAGTPSPALDVLGRCLRKQPCEGAGAMGGGLAQALHLINGPTINGKLGGGDLSRMLADGLSDRAIIVELYERALTRAPEAHEVEEWERVLAEAADRPDRGAVLEDLLWALLNSREFAFNH